MAHVFVTRGNITHLNVDACLLPTDSILNVTDSWTSDTFTREALDAGLKEDLGPLRDGSVFSMALPRAKRPVPILTAVPLLGATTFDDLSARLRAGLAEAARVAADVNPDGRRLIATPAFGVKGGGANEARGEVIAGILTTAQEVATEHDIDVVVCLRNPVDHAALMYHG